MGALHAGHVALLRAARAECDVRRREPLRQPGAVRATRSDLAAYPRDFERDARDRRRPPASTSLFAPAAGRALPARLRDLGRAGGRRRGPRGRRTGPGHFRGVATVCLKLFNIVRPRRRLLRPQGRAAGRGAEAARARPRTSTLEIRVVADGARRRRARALVAQRAALAPRSASARSRSRGRSRPATRQRARACSPRPAIEPDYVAVADLDGPTLAVAARVGTTA